MYIGETENFREHAKESVLLNLPEYQHDSTDDFFEDTKFLASFIGRNIFEFLQPKVEFIFYVKITIFKLKSTLFI